MSEPHASESSGASAAAGAVLVGIDGSDSSRAALDHACDEAGWRALPLVAVIAVEPPDLWITPAGLVPPAERLQEAGREVAGSVVEAVSAARAARGAPMPEVRVLVRSGPPAVVLETLSSRAALLVLGHRGRGVVASRLIGSVGLSVVLHAACSVTVVRS